MDMGDHYIFVEMIILYELKINIATIIESYKKIRSLLQESKHRDHP
jgi:hypothetical protein